MGLRLCRFYSLVGIKQKRNHCDVCPSCSVRLAVGRGGSFRLAPNAGCHRRCNCKHHQPVFCCTLCFFSLVQSNGIVAHPIQPLFLVCCSNGMTLLFRTDKSSPVVRLRRGLDPSGEEGAGHKKTDSFKFVFAGSAPLLKSDALCGLRQRRFGLRLRADALLRALVEQRLERLGGWGRTAASQSDVSDLWI